jgi:hypothetical protein
VYVPEEHDVSGLDRLERSEDARVEPEPPVEDAAEDGEDR